jgi:hypothetical protein
MMLEIFDFYEHEAALYEAVSRDRDFPAQVGGIRRLVQQSEGEASRTIRVLELFAGPAYHSKVFKITECASVVCVDASQGMKELALRDGVISEQEYLVGRLPEAMNSLGNNEPFDCVLALRYSLGYLDDAEVEVLLLNARSIMRPGAIFVAELHRLDLLVGGLDALEIRDRIAYTEQGSRIRCVWPHGPLKWDTDDLVVEMEVLVEVDRSTGASEQFLYKTREHIHYPARIRRVARLSGHYDMVMPSEAVTGAFKESTMLMLRAV